MDQEQIEIWKPVTDFPNTEVSNLGRVRSLFRGGCKIRSLIKHENGYLTVGLQRGRIKKRARVHILVANAFVGPNPAKLDVNHKDGDKTNNRADNLEYVTRSENLKHAFKMGLAWYTPFRERGENKPNTTLRDQDVITMREEFAKGVSRHDLAARYKISYYTVWDITARRRWTHI